MLGSQKSEKLDRRARAISEFDAEICLVVSDSDNPAGEDIMLFENCWGITDLDGGLLILDYFGDAVIYYERDRWLGYRAKRNTVFTIGEWWPISTKGAVNV